MAAQVRKILSRHPAPLVDQHQGEEKHRHPAGQAAGPAAGEWDGEQKCEEWKRAPSEARIGCGEQPEQGAHQGQGNQERRSRGPRPGGMTAAPPESQNGMEHGQDG